MERIAEEIDCLSEEQRSLVRVCVADNGSTDNTPIVVSRHQERFGEKFEAVRNSDNMGMDFNFTRCYELAKTPYVWVFGDDDVLLPGGLKKVLDVLSNNEIDILYVNNYWFKNSYMEKPRKKELHGTFTDHDSLTFTRRTNVMLTFLSGLIVRGGVGLNYRNELAGSTLVQLSWVFPLLRDGKKFAVIEDWVVAAQGSNSGGYSLVKVFGENLQRISLAILKDKPELVRVIQNGAIINFFPAFILEFRRGATKFEDKEMVDGLRQAFANNWRYYVFLVPLLLLPMYFARIFNRLLKESRYLLRLFI